MSKKILALLLALVMSLSLVACADQPTVSDDTADDDSQLQQEVVEKDDTANADTDNNADTDHPIPPSDSKDDVAADAGNNGDETEPAAGESDNISSDKGIATEDDKPSVGTTEQEHKHNYTSKVTAASCTAGGYTTYTCSCGDSYKSNYTNKLGHNYSDKVVAPTTTAQGYTLHKCGRCGDSYKDSYTAATGSNSGSNTGNASGTTTPSTPTHQHNYVSSVVAGTCTTKGYTTFTCSCGDSYKANYTGGNGHSWAPVYEEVAIYETVCITRCGHCHANLNDVGGEAHIKEEALAGNGARSYESYEQVQVGTETEIVGYACSACGTDK